MIGNLSGKFKTNKGLSDDSEGSLALSENEGQMPASTAATEETPENKPVSSIPEQPSGHGMSKTQTALLVFALCCSTFLAALDITIITTALPTISEHFHTKAGYIWVGAAYILAEGASTPVWGKVSDIWGRKPVLVIAIAVFFIGSALSAMAVSMAMLIAGRAVQGLGGGGLVNLSTIVIADLFSMRGRSKYGGFLGMTWAIACSIGPLLGGALSEKASWRWCFYINLPCTAVVLVLVLLTLKLKTPKTPLVAGLKAMDWLGCLTVVGGTVMVLVGLNLGGSSYPWKSVTVICLLVFGAATLILFILVEWKIARVPIIPLSIFSTWQRLGALIAALLHGFVLSINFYFLPLYFQSVLGAGALFSGVLLLPMAISVSVVDALTGWGISATGVYTWFIRGGFFLMTLGSGLLIGLPHSRQWAQVVIFQIILGAGIGPNFQALTIAFQSTVKSSDVGTATSTFSFARNLATSIGLVLGEVVFQNVMRGQYNKLSGPLGPELAGTLTNGGAASSVFRVDKLPADQKTAARDAYYIAIRDLWILQTVFSAVGLVAICFIRDRVLSKDHTVVETGLEVEARRAAELEKERMGGRAGRQDAAV